MLFEAARLYYVENLTQELIARRIGVSRSYVSRMLGDARSQGLVEIKVHQPLWTVEDLESELAARLGLQDSRILASAETDVNGWGHAGSAGGMAALTARYMQNVITDNDVVGLGWSQTVYRSVDDGYLQKKNGVAVVQLMGSVGGSIPELNGITITARVADALGAHAHYLHAPMLVDNATVREGLLRDPSIRSTLEIARRADVMVVGVGAIDRNHGQYRTGYIDDADLEYIRESGAVADVCGSYLSYDGSLIPLEMNERTIAVNSEDMKGIPKRIGVSWGPEIATAIIAAVRSGLVNMLVTDEPTARKMLESLESEGSAAASENNSG